MDKYVGSSERAMRDIFDNPPDIYGYFREQEPDNGDAIAKAVRKRVTITTAFLHAHNVSLKDAPVVSNSFDCITCTCKGSPCGYNG